MTTLSAPRDAKEVASGLEALLLRSVIASSARHLAGDSAGAPLRADLFAEALADALVKGGGLGLATLLQTSLTKVRDRVDDQSTVPREASR